MRLSISGKIGGSFSILGASLLICGLAGYLGANTLSQSMRFITGPAWETNDGALESRIGVQGQLLAVNRFTRGSDPQALERLTSFDTQTQTAMGKINSAHLVPTDTVSELNHQFSTFTAAREELLKSNTRYRDAVAAMNSDVEHFQDFLVDIEEFASRRLVELAVDVNNAEGATEAKESDEMFVAAAATEARLALLSRLYLFQKFREAQDAQETEEKMKNGLADLAAFIDELRGYGFLAEPYPKAPFAGEPYEAVLGKLLSDHTASYQAVVAAYRTLQSVETRYGEEAQRIDTLVRNIGDESRTRISSEISQVESTQGTVLVTIAGSVAVGVVLALLAFMVSARTISHPIRQVANKLRDIAEGDGDLTATLDNRSSDELGQLSQSFNRFIGKIRGIVHDVADVTQHLGASAHQMETITEQTGVGIRRQRSETDQIAAATRELADSVNAVMEKADSAARCADEADRKAHEGQQVVQETIAAIRRLADEVARAGEVIRDLESRSDRIGGVLEVISGIAEQTNLLALNAAIEAARAGDQGRGFAVVADEVRTLASRTQSSTHEIEEIITLLQEGARHASQAMESSHQAADEGVRRATEAGEALDGITRSITVIKSENREIATAAKSQGARMSEIDRNVGNISQVANQTADAAAQTQSSSVELAALAERLQTLIGQFKA